MDRRTISFSLFHRSAIKLDFKIIRDWATTTKTCVHRGHFCHQLFWWDSKYSVEWLV